jgi:hypothetical protein
MSLLERYSAAMRTSDLSAKATPDATVNTDNDVVGAFGFASKDRPLAMALARLFCGDNAAERQLVELLAEMAWEKAAAMRLDLKRTQAREMARAVLAWHRDGRCPACTGRGFDLIVGAPAVSATPCMACDGTRKVPFAREFEQPVRVVAWWLVAEVEREQSRAGPAAMARLAERICA